MIRSRQRHCTSHTLICARGVACLLVGLVWWLPLELEAGDWPQWRYGAGRGAVSPDELPAELHLQWVRVLAAPRPAWPASQPWLRFDLSYSPVAAGKRLFVPSMVTDSVTAYETDSGAERWRFVTDGPVRLAPVVHKGRVYFGSDDGYLYCVDAETGRLVWRFRGGPSDRKVLGNERLISTWPVRGGPVLLDGTLYFSAGIWPWMGIFVHAVDAASGEAVWTNSGEGASYTVQPHNSPAFSGFFPRGHLAATPKGLVAPGGRTAPGCYDLQSGDLYSFSFGSKGGGSYHVTACGDWFFVNGTMRQIVDGKTVLATPAVVHDDRTLYGLSGDEISAQSLEVEDRPVEQTDRRGRIVTVNKCRLKPLWKGSIPEAPGKLFLKAGSRFYAGREGRVAALEVDPKEGRAAIAWRAEFEGIPWTMLAADNKLFVVTTAGRIYCFGAGKQEPKTYSDMPSAETTAAEKQPPPSADPWNQRAETVVKTTRATEGYCLLLGLGSGRLAEELLRQSRLHLIAVDPDARKIDAFRRRMIEAGLYGSRVAAHVGDPVAYPWPPYLARLIVSEDLRAAGAEQGAPLVKAVFRALRPYGGAAYLPITAANLQDWVAEAQPHGARVAPAGDRATLLFRDGPLPGAADWTHQYADAANSVVSKDTLVKAPLGLLWFGGPPNDKVLPRHGHGPSPQVAAGRLFIEGGNMLRALDIYTGRLLWQKDLPGLGTFYDHTNHQPGAGEIGSNYVSLDDSVYVVYGEVILELDAATGRVTREFKSEPGSGGRPANWGFLAAWNDQFIATWDPVSAKAEGDSRPATVADALAPVRFSSASRRLVAIDRRSGRKLWQRDAEYGFRHNNIVVGAGKLFCIDGLSRAKQDALKRRGRVLDDYAPRLWALDVRTGKEIWSTGEDVFGTFLGYSAEHDVLLQAGSAARDRARDESSTGMVAYRGTDGGVIWKNLELRYSGPCMLHHDTIITQGPAYSLLTGEPKTRQHPLTGEPIEWQFTRNYGCNTAVAGEHLVLFRSAAAGFYDLQRDGGTGNLGGFKSGCTSNLIAAGGLLNAPEYTRTCGCNYQNQTSLAMIHDPEAEVWTFNALAWDGKPVRRVGINFGAPGDRRADDGTLWLDYPSRGGPSPDLPVLVEPPDARYFHRHSALVQVTPNSGGLAWVAASGVEGVRRVTVTLAAGGSAEVRKYTVRLHFAEPNDARPGQRVVNLRLQGKEVLSGFDVARQAGPATAMVKEFTGVEVADKLEVSLAPAAGGTSSGPVLCGIEIVAEGW